VIALTAHALKGDRERCLAAGMDDYLAKPIRLEELEAVLHKFLVGASGATAPPHASTREVAAVPEQPWEREKVLLRVGGDPELCDQVLSIFSEEAPKLIENLRAAFAAHDAGRVEQLAHSLKGQAGYIALDHVAEAALKLEQAARAQDSKAAEALFRTIELDISAALHWLASTEQVMS
jgi:HPt (histidine-containing phosphotransfer) domain-containing protein